MIKRLLITFVVLYVPLAILDLMTTLTGLQMGFRELNPLLDTTTFASTIMSSTIKNFVFFTIGILSITLGCKLSSREAIDASSGTFKAFYKAFSSTGNLLSFILIYLSLVLASGRIFPVINNLMFINFGWGIMSFPISLSAITGISERLTVPVTWAICLLILMKPVIYIVYKCYASDISSRTHDAAA